MKQAVRLGGRHNMPPPRDLDFWPFDLEVGVGVRVACDLGYPCAKFRLPRPFGFRVRANVRDIRQTDRQTDADQRIMPPRRGHNEKSYSNTTNCASLGAVNKLQRWVLAACDGRTLLTTPDGHTVDNKPKSYGNTWKCARSWGPDHRLGITLGRLKMLPLNSFGIGSDVKFHEIFCPGIFHEIF